MTNTFRSTYRELSESEKSSVADIKDRAEEMLTALRSAEAGGPPRLETTSHPNARMFAIARTKLEECVMWATKAVTG